MPEDNDQTLSQILQEHGWSQSRLARELEVVDASVYRWASGNQALPPARARQIETLLELEPNSLSRFESKRKPGRIPDDERPMRPSQTILHFIVMWFVDGHWMDFGNPGPTARNFAKAVDRSEAQLWRWMLAEETLHAEEALNINARIRWLTPLTFKDMVPEGERHLLEDGQPAKFADQAEMLRRGDDPAPPAAKNRANR